MALLFLVHDFCRHRFHVVVRVEWRNHDGPSFRSGESINHLHEAYLAGDLIIRLSRPE